MGAAAEPAAARPDSPRVNVIALYLLQAASYGIPLVTMPWLVRKLGADQYGMLAFSQAVAMYVVFFVDAGFNQSAARWIAVDRDRPGHVAQYYWATQRMRMKLGALGLAALAAAVLAVPAWRAQWPLFAIQALMVAGTIAMPVWYFTGMEKMKYIALFNVAGRVASALGILLWIDDPSDLPLAALLQASATLLSGVAVQVLLLRRALPPVVTDPAIVGKLLHEGRRLFAAGFVQPAAGGSTVFILGLFAPNDVVGMFAALDKLARAVVSLFVPVTAALLPLTARAWAAGGGHGPRLTRRIRTAAVATAAVVGALIALESQPLLHLAFGTRLDAYDGVLKFLAAWIFLNVTNTVVGQFDYVAPGHQPALARLLLVGVLSQCLLALLFTWMGGMPGLVTGVVLAEGGVLGLLWAFRKGAA